MLRDQEKHNAGGMECEWAQIMFSELSLQMVSSDGRSRRWQEQVMAGMVGVTSAERQGGEVAHRKGGEVAHAQGYN